MSDRLAELRRQRQLIQEHLAWLDHEIAAAGAAPPEAAPEPAAAANNAPAPKPPVESTAVAAEADALLRQYSSSPESLQKDVRKGCFLYFALASVAVIALVTVLYFALSRR